MRAPKKILGAIAGISMLATTFGIGSAALAAAPTYYDIYDLTTLAQNAINGLYQAGIMNGTAPGKFSPDGVVTRAQAVKFVVNLMGVQLQYPRTPSYSDVSTSSQYYPYIETALNDGYLSGFAGTSGNFDPSAPVTRIQLAILEINALGDQSLAQSLATNTTLYPKLTDLSKVPSGDLGYANAGMKLGLVPPLNGTLYFPNGKVTRVQLAVGLWRALGQLKASAPASLKISQSATSVGVGQVDSLTVTVLNKAGQPIPQANLAPYTISFSVTGSNASSASVSSSGQFVASASGNYTVQASVSGGVLTAPVTGSTTVGVYGAPAALQLKPASATVVADGTATDTVTVTVVDSNGLPVGNFSGTVDIADTPSQTPTCGKGSSTTGMLGCAVNANAEPSDFAAGPPSTVSIANGTGTFTVGGTTTVGETDTLTVTNSNLTAGTATVTSVAPTASTLALSISSNPTAQPSALSANTQTSTLVQVAFEDSAGNAMTTGVSQYVTLTLTGPGSFVAGSTPVTTYSVFDPGTTNVPVYSEPGQPGNIVVTAKSSGGLTAQPLTIPTYINTTPASLSVTSTTGTDTSGNTYTEYTVTVDDTNGHAITSLTSGTITVTDNASSGNGALVYSTNGTTFSPAPATGLPVNIGTSGVFSFYVETQTVGTGPVTLTITGTAGSVSGLSTTASYTYTAGPAASVTLSPSANPYKVLGGTTLTVSAQVVDGHGNPVSGAGQYVTFQVPTNTDGVVLPNGLTTETVATNANGVASLTLSIPNPTSSTLPGPSFTVDANLGTTAGSQATETVTVEPSTNTSDYATQLTATSTSLSATAGQALWSSSTPLIVTADNATGGAVTTADELTVTSSNPNVVSIPSNYPAQHSGTAFTTLTAGMAGTAVLTVTDVSDPAQPKIDITVTVAAGQTATQEVIEYNNAPISSTNPVNVKANTPIELMVVNTDGAYDPIPVTGSNGLTVNLSVASTVTGGFLSAPGGAPISSVVIPVGSSEVPVYFESSVAETITSGLIASTNSSGSTAPNPTSLTAGTAIPLTFTFESNGAPLVNQIVSFSQAGLTNAKFGTSSTASSDTAATASAVTGVTTDTNGQATIYVTDTNATDTGTVSATVGTIALTSGTVTVVPAGVSQLVWTTEPAANETAGALYAAAVTAEDQYKNVVTTLGTGAPSGFTIGGSLDAKSPNGTSATLSVTWNNGVGSVTITPVDAQTGATLTASATGVPNAISNAVTVSPAVGTPTIGTATEAATGITVTWTAPSGTTPSSYQVLEEAVGGTSYTAVPAANGGTPTGTSTTVTGLTAGTSYTFEVEAVDAYGNDSAPSAATTAVEWGTKATSLASSSFTAATSSTAGSVTITLTYDKTLPAQTPDQTFTDYTVTDTSVSKTLTVTAASVNSSGQLVLTVNIPVGYTTVAATDSVTVTTSKSVVTDSAGAPSANVNVSGSL